MIQPKPEILQQWGIHYLSKPFILATLAKVTAKLFGLFIFLKHFFFPLTENKDAWSGFSFIFTNNHSTVPNQLRDGNTHTEHCNFQGSIYRDVTMPISNALPYCLLGFSTDVQEDAILHLQVTKSLAFFNVKQRRNNSPTSIKRSSCWPLKSLLFFETRARGSLERALPSEWSSKQG